MHFKSGESNPQYRHGLWQHPLYQTWQGIKQRCHTTKHKQYKDYGGRGITLCSEWYDNFAQFVEDMGDRPEGHTVDRIDNDKGYSKDNCRWADAKTQSNNRRPRRKRV